MGIPFGSMSGVNGHSLFRWVADRVIIRRTVCSICGYDVAQDMDM